MTARLDAGRRMRRIHPQLAEAEGQRLARGVTRGMVRRRRAPEEARAAIQEGAGMGARGCGRCALGMLGAVGARRRGGDKQRGVALGAVGAMPWVGA